MEIYKCLWVCSPHARYGCVWRIDMWHTTCYRNKCNVMCEMYVYKMWSTKGVILVG